MGLADQSFKNFGEWRDNASSWLTSHSEYHPEFYRAICFDALGRICLIGRDFMQAEKDGAFPVYWLWPDQNLFIMVDSINRKVYE